MKTNSIIKLTTLLFAVAVFSCQKENNQSANTDQEEEQASIATTQSEAQSEIIFNDVFDNVMGANNDVGMQGTGVFGRSTTTGTSETAKTMGCYTTTITHLNPNEFFPLRIELDFGGGCPGKDGRVRSGKIITEYTGRLIVPGKTSTTTFVNYKVDTTSVEGIVKVTNASTTSIRQFNIDITGGKLTNPSGGYVKWSSHKEIKQTEGLGTPELYLDDVFAITGHSEGEVHTSTYATAWESHIAEPLRKMFTCPWISKGVVKVIRKNLSADSKWVGILNFGNGSCDNKATLTVNQIEHQITLH